MNNLPTQTNRVSLLFDAFIESATHDPVEARTIMQEEGLDPDSEVQSSLALIRKLQGRAELAIAKQRTVNRHERAKSIRNKLRQTLATVSDPLTYLADLLTQRGQDAMQLHFRKLENVSADDALDMIDETELLSIFEDLDDEDSSETL